MLVSSSLQIASEASALGEALSARAKTLYRGSGARAPAGFYIELRNLHTFVCSVFKLGN